MCARKTFYIFAKAADRQQFCAVRQDQPIPRMIDGARWTYAGCIDIARDRLFGFDADAAQAATRGRGVYYYRRELFFHQAGLLREAA